MEDISLNSKIKKKILKCLTLLRHFHEQQLSQATIFYAFNIKIHISVFNFKIDIL